MAKTAMSQLEDQVELIRREAFAAGYAAAMQAVHEIASGPAPAANLPTPTAPARRGRPPRPLTSAASWGLIQIGGDGCSPRRRVGIVVETIQVLI